MSTCTNLVGLSTEEEEEEEEEDGEIGVLAVFPCVTVADYFTYFEASIGYRTTPRPGYVSKKAYNCRVREFRAVLYVKANGRVGAIPT